MDFRVLMMGDCAFTVEFTNLMGTEGAKRVRALRGKIEAVVAKGDMDEIIDMISTSRSLTICLPPACQNYTLIRDRVSQLAQEPVSEDEASTRSWCLPVCYQGEYAPDIDEVAKRSGLSCEEVINLHCSSHYSILMIGFLPGFPFMSEVDERLRFPRRESPRTRVPAGSVAIANDQTAIYPWESPGGWHLLGRCPVPLFNSGWDVPSLLQPGETVSFDAINKKDFILLEQDLLSGKKKPSSFLREGN